MNKTIANFIFVFHLCIIIFVLVTPFTTDNIMLLLLHMMLIFSILIHWSLNEDICVLTVLEGYFRGIAYKDGFLQNLIGPMYNFKEKEISYLCFILMLISAKKTKECVTRKQTKDVNQLS